MLKEKNEENQKHPFLAKSNVQTWLMKPLTGKDQASLSVLFFEVQFTLQSFNVFKAVAAIVIHTPIRSKTECANYSCSLSLLLVQTSRITFWYTPLSHLTHFHLAKQNGKLVEHVSYSCSFEKYFYWTTCVCVPYVVIWLPDCKVSVDSRRYSNCSVPLFLFLMRCIASFSLKTLNHSLRDTMISD